MQNMMQNASSDEDVHCLPLIQQFYTQDQVVKNMDIFKL